MTYYNTTNQVQPELALYEAKAEKQDDLILDIFKARPLVWMSPFKVHDILIRQTGKNIPITSTRRAITNLEQSGKLVKSETADEMGPYGKPNYSWRVA